MLSVDLLILLHNLRNLVSRLRILELVLVLRGWAAVLDMLLLEVLALVRLRRWRELLLLVVVDILLLHVLRRLLLRLMSLLLLLILVVILLLLLL